MRSEQTIYTATIGLEVHVQLKTKSKMFCSCKVEYGAEPNTHTCPICLGLPGALPSINEEALHLTTLAGLMLECAIPPVCKFDRKNYFYPDMPKNYQISQFDQPLCLGGAVPLHQRAYPKDVQKTEVAAEKKIRLTRIHLEEDVAKSFHLGTTSGIDFNRAGTPLMEIVSEADIASPEEAFAYLSALRQILVYGNISDADMEKGQMRCDVNVSIRPQGQKEYGTKIELKNLNTISGVRRALAFEIERQTAVLLAGGSLAQETRRWDDDRGETTLMRIKESSHDYRYFTDPDLLPLHTEKLVLAATKVMPELPQAKRDRFIKEYEISDYDAAVLTDDLALASYFEESVTAALKTSSTIKPKILANWIINDLLSALSTASLTLAECSVTPPSLAELIVLIEKGTISGRQGKEVFAEMMASGTAATVIVQEKGLEQVSDSSAIEAFCDQVIAAHPSVVADFKAGKEVALNFLKGQVMKLSKGKANPALAGEILVSRLAD
ncbi:MAG: glutaminyl-tRNA synthase (glutamine-hydrolyzing) subunit B [Verrucomicrobia bacterium RIFCSPHIGHO2_12_FULL_41_10]|nr:MAG: glutaminyl-tRNA synthase (glutamine-hydrolyzing) subunit B [Verrucomicrobia bacterium RIFCSPHIGHO2_12_FULL_41_10]